jgi:hypothetical protein
MEPDTDGSREHRQRKRRDRVIGTIAALGVLAAVIYKLVWPWSSLRTDLVFLGIILVGIVAAVRLKNES